MRAVVTGASRIYDRVEKLAYAPVNRLVCATARRYAATVLILAACKENVVFDELSLRLN